jgi:RNA exonuclease 1
VPGDAGSAGSSLESSDLEQESASDSDKGSEAGERVEAAIERRCARCARLFYVGHEDGEYLREEKCCYHWGKLRDALWECCRARESSRGCASAKAHVWTGLVPGFNGPFADYARTRPSRQVPRDGNYGVYALDCEMCFTKRGLELGKVTVVALDGQVVYEALVKPDSEVIDYNTRFSGLRPRDLAKASKSLRQVQKDITSFVSAETILIGHGLENDLRALRILHPTVVDTCVAFPHFLGYPFRNSLKTLARTVLRREIQVKEHDSAEDARIAVDLMLTRLQHDFF